MNRNDIILMTFNAIVCLVLPRLVTLNWKELIKQAANKMISQPVSLETVKEEAF